MNDFAIKDFIKTWVLNYLPPNKIKEPIKVMPGKVELHSIYKKDNLKFSNVNIEIYGSNSPLNNFSVLFICTTDNPNSVSAFYII